MFNIFELLYNFFTGKSKKETTSTVVQIQEPVEVKKVKKPRKKKVTP